MANQTVLVVEDGSAPTVIKSYQVPGADQQVLGECTPHHELMANNLSLWTGSQIDWGFVTAPQTGLDGRQIAYNRELAVSAMFPMTCCSLLYCRRKMPGWKQRHQWIDIHARVIQHLRPLGLDGQSRLELERRFPLLQEGEADPLVLPCKDINLVQADETFRTVFRAPILSHLRKTILASPGTTPRPIPLTARFPLPTPHTCTTQPTRLWKR